jgi:hypothetical protein
MERSRANIRRIVWLMLPGLALAAAGSIGMTATSGDAVGLERAVAWDAGPDEAALSALLDLAFERTVNGMESGREAGIPTGLPEIRRSQL